MRRPRDRGQSPRTVRPPRPHPAWTSRSCPSCLGFGGVGVGTRHTVRRMQGCRDRSRGNCVPRCGILGSVGGGYRPCGRPAPSRHARAACAEALGLLQGMVVRRTTGHVGALIPGERTKGATDAGMRCTRCQGPPRALPTRGCAVRGAKAHPHTPSTLVAHVVRMQGLAPWWRGGSQPTPRRHLV